MLNPLNDKAMKRRILMVSAMILLLSSQVQIYAQKKGGPGYKKPGLEMHQIHKPGKPMVKPVRQSDIRRVQDFYWKKYRVRLTRSEAERILIGDVKYSHNCKRQTPPPPKKAKPYIRK